MGIYLGAGLPAPGCTEPTSYCSTGEATPNTTHVLQGVCAGAKNATHAVLVKVVRGKAAPPCRCANDVHAEYPATQNAFDSREASRCGRPTFEYPNFGGPGWPVPGPLVRLICLAVAKCFLGCWFPTMM